MDIKKLGGLIGFVVVFLFFNSTVGSVMLDGDERQVEQSIGIETAATERAEFNTREPISPEQQQMEKRKVQYVPGEIIVKLKEKEKPVLLFKQQYSARKTKHTNILSGLKEKYRLRDEKPVFKRLHKQLETRNFTQNQLRAENNAKLFKQHSKTPKPKKQIDLLPIYILNTDEDVLAACAKLNQDPEIEYAQPNYIVEICSEPLPEVPYIPNDYYLEDDENPGYWREGSWGQVYPDLWGLRNTHTIEAWNLFDTNSNGVIDGGEKYPGEGVVVAVIDTGVDRYHEDLAENIWSNEDEIPDNGLDDDGNGYIDDVWGWDFANDDNNPFDGNGHGTHCSGTIAAVGNNDIGIVGVAPKAKIMAVKGLGDAGSGNIGWLAECIKYAADNGADILSNSWGPRYPLPVSTDRLAEDAIEHAYGEEDCVVVFSAGNSSGNVAFYYGANHPYTIAVAATDNNDKICDFSNVGELIDISAPGGGSVADDGPDGPTTYKLGRNILSLRAQGTDLYAESDLDHGLPAGIGIVDEHYYRARGTSMACPHVAGLAAVIKSMYPTLTNDEIRSRIVLGADNIDSLNPGFEGLLGGGRFNTYNSLTIPEQPWLKLLYTERDGIEIGATGSMIIHLKNFWQDALGVEVTLSTDSEYATVESNTAVLGDILNGETKSNTDNPFVVYIDETTPLGTVIDFELTITAQGGYEKIIHFKVAFALFEDVGAQTGLEFLDWWPLSVGLEDYDNDDYADAWFLAMLHGNFYRNEQDGTFINSEEEMGIWGFDYTTWVTLLIDVDNDGDKDLFLGRRAPENSFLFLNEGDGTFSDISVPSGINNTECHYGTAFDYNNDGFIDICAADMYGEVLYLLRNNTDNTFTKIVTETGLPVNLGEFGGKLVSLDYDNDGDQDFLVENAGSSIRFYRNNDDDTFTDVTEAVGIDISRGGVKAAAAGDYNNDGYIDIFLTGCCVCECEYEDMSVLYKNNGEGGFIDASIEAGEPGWGQNGYTGTAFFDLNNDGYLDIHMTVDNYSKTRSNTFFLNNGDGTFTDITESILPEGIAPGGADAGIGDYNNDGALDIYAPTGAFGSGSGAFLKNIVGTRNNWIKIKLEDLTTNRLGYGARVYLTTGNNTQTREVHIGTVETTPLHFGLGEATIVDEIEVHWPISGQVQTLTNVASNQILTITAEPYVYLKNISPNPADEGMEITLTGKLFGSIQGAGYVEFPGELYPQIISWSNTEIICVVPENVINGNVYVITDTGERSNGICFRENTPPEVTITFPEDGGYTSSTLLIKGKVIDYAGDIGYVTVSVDGIEDGTATVAGGNFSYEIEGLTLGARMITVTAEDECGRIDSQSITVNVVEPGTCGWLQFSSTAYRVKEEVLYASIQVARTGDTSHPVTVDYQEAGGGSATAGEDYCSCTTSGRLTFAEGVSSAEFSVRIFNDSKIEGDETIHFILTNPTGGAGLGEGPNEAVLTILDSAGGTLKLSSSEYTVNEEEGSVTIKVIRTEKYASQMSVDYETSNGTAEADTDYIHTEGTLIFSHGDLEKTFTIDINNDEIYEGNETINLSLSNPTPEDIAVLGSPSTATLTIIDNSDLSFLRFSTSDYIVNEAIGTASITVQRTGKVNCEVTVDYFTGDDGTETAATAGVDYIPVSDTLTFPEGETEQTFTVTIIDDPDIEWSEILNLTLDNPTGDAVLAYPFIATLRIVDNDTKFADSGIYLQGVSMGSLAWGDYDNDGDLDLAVVGDYSATRIYKNTDGVLAPLGELPDADVDSLAWGDYDNDGDLDLAICGGGSTRIYENSNNTFAIEAELAGVDEGSLAWGDYDNDGDLDLAICGDNTTKIYQNSDDSTSGYKTFTDIWAELPGVQMGSLAWGDYDNDGDLDLAVCGSYSGGTGDPITRIYTNNNNTFELGAELAGVDGASFAWGDYDNDGDLDLAVCGDSYSEGLITRIYKNTDNTFEMGAELTGVFGGSLAWGDYDNDGDLDLAVCGNSWVEGRITRIYENNGDDDTFPEADTRLPGVSESSLAWGDYDNDGDLDLAICGNTEDLGAITRIYVNNSIVPNTLPNPPTNLAYEEVDNSIFLEWDTGSDTETSDSGLYYNLRVGTIPGGEDIVSGIYGSPLFGNYLRPKLSLEQLGVRLENLPTGTYYWSVQTIDTSLKASEWSEEVMFDFGYIQLFAISGEVILKGGSSAVSEVLLSLSGDLISSTYPLPNGHYNFFLEEGNYAITPSLGDYHFFPSSYSYALLDSNQTNQDFIGLYETYDSDEDGLPDWWEWTYFGEGNLIYGPDDDPDSDNWTNWEEYTHGTDPNDAGSIPLFSVSGEVTLEGSSGGNSLVWVKVPEISSQDSSIIYMYYGNPDASGDQTPEDVWDANYLMVQHLQEAPANDEAGHIDSTSNNFDGTPMSFDAPATTNGIGQIGGADIFDNTGDGNGIYINGSSGTGSALNIYNEDMTISSWVKWTGTGGTIVARARPNYITYWLRIATDKACASVYTGDHHTVSTDSILNPDTWYHIAGVFDRDSDQAYIYVNGVLEGSGTLPDAKSGDSGPTKIGCRNDYNDYEFNGTIDEVRISDIARSSAWIKACYYSEMDELITFGEEEVVYGSPWNYRRALYIDPANIDETLTDFPLCVKLDSSRIAYTGSGGLDIRFTDALGNPLKYEIESWDESGVTKVLLTLTGPANDTIYPESNGDYIFTDLERDSYILVPSLEGYYFFPYSRSYPFLDSDQVNQDFIGLHETYDSDEDGLPDWWELENFENLSYGPDADPDGDGYSNLEEYLCGSDPNDANSLPIQPTSWNSPTQSYGDTDGDGYVGAADWQIYYDAFYKNYWDHWNNGSGPYDPRADFNRDGYVDIRDWPPLRDNWEQQVPADGPLGGTWPPEQL